MILMTIKEIAKRANVSQGTVDRVIHNRGKVAKEKKERILKIMEEVDYKPNIYARGLVLNKTYKIVALVPEFNAGEYWEVPSRGIKKAVEDFEQFGIKIEFSYFDQNEIQSFKDQADLILMTKPDGVIIAPVINFEAVKLTSRLNKMQIPFSLIDSNIPNSGTISYIGQDAFQSGRLAAKLLYSCTRGSNLLIVSIKNNENHNKTLQKRIEGFNDYLLKGEDYTDIELEEIIINQRERNWKKNLETFLMKKKPDGIYVPSSKVHFVAEFLYNHNNFSCSLVGNDLIQNNTYYIESGTIDYVIGQRPETQGYLALESFYKYLVSKQTVKKIQYLPLDIITKENLSYYNNIMLR